MLVDYSQIKAKLFSCRSAMAGNVRARIRSDQWFFNPHAYAFYPTTFYVILGHCVYAELPAVADGISQHQLYFFPNHVIPKVLFLFYIIVASQITIAQFFVALIWKSIQS